MLVEKKYYNILIFIYKQLIKNYSTFEAPSSKETKCSETSYITMQLATINVLYNVSTEFEIFIFVMVRFLIRVITKIEII